MAINRKQEERKNRYAWRLDFSLLGEDNYNSEIGKEIKKNSGAYKVCLWFLAFGVIILALAPIVLLICHANLTYIIISGFIAFLMCLMYSKIMKAKISRSELEKIEDELKVQSYVMKEYDAILTENTLIVLQGVMIYRIPYHEISKIRVRWGSIRTGGTQVCYTTRDGSQVEITYYVCHTSHILFDALWEQLLKYNSNIMIDDSKKVRNFWENI